jgi:hypothetical protein
MASLEQLQRLGIAANAASSRFDRPSTARLVVEAGQALVREAKAAGLACERKVEGDKRGYDCLDPVTRALFQVRVRRAGDTATLNAGVFGIDRARRPAESPLAKAKRERDDVMRELESCQRSCGTSSQRSLFG